MHLQVNGVSILLAIVASFIVGFLWHGPLFGKQWIKLNKLPTPKKGEMKFSMMLPGIIASIVMAFMQALLLGMMFDVMDIVTLTPALLITATLWLPFTGLVLVNEYAWLGKSPMLMAYDALYNLVSMCAITAVLIAMA